MPGARPVSGGSSVTALAELMASKVSLEADDGCSDFAKPLYEQIAV